MLVSGTASVQATWEKLRNWRLAVYLARNISANIQQLSNPRWLAIRRTGRNNIVTEGISRIQPF